jgi:NADH-ubiquinone oxidoreductase chain 4
MPDVNRREFAILVTLVIFAVVLGIYPSIVLDGLSYNGQYLLYNLNVS